MANIGSNSSSVGIGIAFPILGGICVALRFYCRTHLKNPIHLDDWLCLPALLCVTGCCVSVLIRALHKISPDADPVEETEFTAHILAAIPLFWAFANTFIKLSILVFYRRLFVGRIMSAATTIMITLSLIWLAYAIAGWLLFCGFDIHANFEGPWDNCPHWGWQMQLGIMALDSFIDFCILVMPVAPLWRLQLTLPKKVAVTLIFILGGFAFFASLSNSIVQGVYLVQPTFAMQAGGGSFFQDVSTLLFNWPAIEVGVALIASTLPSLSFRVLGSMPQRLMSSWRSSFSKRRGQTPVETPEAKMLSSGALSDFSGPRSPGLSLAEEAKKPAYLPTIEVQEVRTSRSMV